MSDFRNANSFPKPRKQLIVVLGMHRSGTSLATRALQVLNVALGNRLLPAQDDNTTGFWEDSDVYDLNVEMLAALGSDWHRLAILTERDADMLRRSGYFVRAYELIQSRLSEHGCFGLKDPRIARLLPFWKEVFDECGIEPAYVIAVRNPRSVVRSLAKRDGFAPQKSYALWIAHLLSSLHYTAGSTRIVVDYDLLLDHPREQIERLSSTLGLAIDPDEMSVFEQQFVQQGLRHFADDVDAPMLDPACLPLADEVYAKLRSVARSGVGDDRSLKRAVIRWRRELMRIDPLLQMSDVLEANAANLQRSLRSYEARLEGLEGEIADVRRARDQAERRLVEQAAELSEANLDRAQAMADLAAAMAEVRHRDERIEALAIDISAKQALVHDQQAHTEALLTHIAAMDRQIEACRRESDMAYRRTEVAEADAGALRRDLAERQAHVNALLESTSWRITAPLRMLTTGFRRLRGRDGT